MRSMFRPRVEETEIHGNTITDVEQGSGFGTGAMFVGAQKKLPKKERGRKEKGEDYIISHLIKSSH